MARNVKIKFTSGSDRDFRPAGKRDGNIIISIVVALALYVLSTGPVVKLALEDQIPLEFVETVYAPFQWVDRTDLGHKILKAFAHWYGEKLWGWQSPVV